MDLPRDGSYLAFALRVEDIVSVARGFEMEKGIWLKGVK